MEERRAKILVIDDETDVVETLKHFLSVKGYEAIGALSGEQALNILEKESVDLILLDMMMPGLKGADVARVIKEKYPSIKLIIVTGYPEEGKKLAQDTTLEGLFIKPVGIQELHHKLADVLGEKEPATLDTKTKQGIKARVLLIKAKLLFAEPSAQAYTFLSSHFKNLSNRGENFTLDVAKDEGEIFRKLAEVKPDILIFNMNYLNSLEKDFVQKISQSPDKPKEIIIYNLAPSEIFSQDELGRLTKTTEAICFKNGLIEVRWVEI